MRVIVILASLLIWWVQSNSTSESNLKPFYLFKEAIFSKADRGRIITGDQAADGQFPWQVYVIATKGPTTQFTCGGSMISPDWILTAAHCVYHSLKFEIGYGTNIIHGATTTRVSHQSYVHPRYNPRNLNNDIALVKVTCPVSLSNKIQTIRLPNLPEMHKKFVDVMAIVSGWGRNTDLSSPVYLQYTNVKILRNSVCAIRFKSIVVDSTICALGAASKWHNICYGDSGGPLVIQENESFLQIGIVSFVSGAGCTRGHPSGYARITSFREWINDVSGI